MSRILALLLCALALAAGEAPAQRKAVEGLLKELRAACVAGTPTAWAGDEHAALAACAKTADEALLRQIEAAAQRLAEEQAAESAGKPKLLAYAGKKSEALTKLDALAKAFASFPAAATILAEARSEIEEDRPGLLLGDWWHGGAIGSARYVGAGGNDGNWFKPPCEKTAKATGLPAVDFTATDVLGSDGDANGILLYPDGAPRARFLLWPGGSPQECIKALQGKSNAARVREAFAGGMGFVGICSGCFLASEWGFALWPGKMSRKEPVITGPPHDIVMPPFHPLALMLKADRLPQVSFTGGANQMTLDVPGTDYIGFFRNGGYEGMEGNPALIAYQAPGWTGGRMVVTPAHPEASRTDFLVMMADYAMRRRWAMPRHPIAAGTAVTGVCGDRQNQWYELVVGEGAKRIEAVLSGMDGACEVAIRHGEPPRPRAGPGKAAAARGKLPDRKAGAAAKPGRWFVQVYGDHDKAAGATYTLTITVE
jgi:hypothetical protein